MSNTIITIFGIAFIFIMTMLGATLVYFLRNRQSNKFNAIFLGCASGVMIAASIWSLILPAVDLSYGLGKLKFLPAMIGLLLGGLFLIFLDKISKQPQVDLQNSFYSQNKIKKLFFAVTIHNIPEGLAVGFAFGGASLIDTQAAFISALGLAIGIGIQNFPEGAAVAVPITAATGNKNKGFLFGVISGIVEPIFAVAGYFLASCLQKLQPWILSFAAGAMLFVVADDLIPEAKRYENSSLGTYGFIIGFIIMMILDVTLG